MKYLSAFILIFLVAFSRGNAQSLPDLSKYEKDTEKIAVIGGYCNKVLAAGLNTKETCRNMVAASKQGMQLSINIENNYSYSVFTVFVGYGYEFERLHTDSAVFYYEKALADALKWKFDFNVDRASQRLMGLYFEEGMFEKRKQLVGKLAKILDETNDITRKVILSGSLSEYYMSTSQYEKAIFYNLKNIEYQKKDMLNNKQAVIDNIGLKYMQIGNNFMTLHRSDKALEYLELAKEYIKIMPLSKINLYSSFVLVYNSLNQPEKALSYYRKVYAMMSETDSTYTELSQVNQYMAEYFTDKNQLKEATKYGLEAIRFAKKSGNKPIIIGANKTYGSILLKQGNFNGSINYLESAASKAYGYSKENFANIKQQLSKSYASRGEWEKAYKNQQEYTLLKDSLYDEALKKNVAELEAKFQSDARKQEIKLLNSQNNAKNILLEGEKRNRWYLGGGLLLAVIVAALIFINLQTKRKANRLLDTQNKFLDQLNVDLHNANQTKTRLFSIISHDLRRPVSQLFTFLKIQQANSKILSEDDRNAHHQKLMESSKNLLGTMEDLLLWSKSQMERFEVEEEEIDVEELINTVVNSLQAQADDKQIQLEIAKPAFTTLNSDFNLVLTILRNILQNAIDYSFADGKILIICETSQSAQTISVISFGEVVSAEKIETISDNVALKSKSSGYGLMLIKDLAERINAQLTIQSNELKGTEVKITFPSSS